MIADDRFSARNGFVYRLVEDDLSGHSSLTPNRKTAEFIWTSGTVDPVMAVIDNSLDEEEGEESEDATNLSCERSGTKRGRKEILFFFVLPSFGTLTPSSSLSSSSSSSPSSSSSSSLLVRAQRAEEMGGECCGCGGEVAME
jgi:hypothetical protein